MPPIGLVTEQEAGRKSSKQACCLVWQIGFARFGNIPPLPSKVTENNSISTLQHIVALGEQLEDLPRVWGIIPDPLPGLGSFWGKEQRILKTN